MSQFYSSLGCFYPSGTTGRVVSSNTAPHQKAITNIDLHCDPKFEIQPFILSSGMYHLFLPELVYVIYIYIYIYIYNAVSGLVYGCWYIYIWYIYNAVSELVYGCWYIYNAVSELVCGCWYIYNAVAELVYGCWYIYTMLWLSLFMDVDIFIYI